MRSAPISVLRSLPLARWTERLLEGRVTLRGTILASATLQVDGSTLELEPGPLTATLTFQGGQEPHVTELVVEGTGQTVALREAASGVAEHLLDHIHDLALDVLIRTDGEVVLDIGNGLLATLADGGSISLRATAEGTPAAPRLAEPLRVDVPDQGIRVTHGRAPGLSKVARVRVRRFALHPDGSVHLDGAGRGVLDFAVTTSLRRASSRLSTLIRESPRFERLRTFLRTND